MTNKQPGRDVCVGNLQVKKQMRGLQRGERSDDVYKFSRLAGTEHTTPHTLFNIRNVKAGEAVSTD